MIMSGDVEQNPGPPKIRSKESVDGETVLDVDDDLMDVKEAVFPVVSRWYELGECLRLKTSNLETLRSQQLTPEKSLSEVLKLWLRKAYNVERFGPPTWKRLVEVVAHDNGGGDPALAEKIAAQHPWPAKGGVRKSADRIRQGYEPRQYSLAHANGWRDPSQAERIAAEHPGDCPQSWNPMPKDKTSGKEEPVCLVDLPQESEEYKKVLTEFNKTMNPASYNKIEKIQRVQNPMLYGLYQVKKKWMKKQNPPGHNNELFLWHGTQPSTCPKINIQGFNRSFAGRNASIYGRGVYFVRDASYSARDTYSPPDQNGYKYIYLVRVLVGEYTVGSNSMLVPPPKDPSKNPDILFDSVADNTANPQVFAVFHDANAYPEYLVVFS